MASLGAGSADSFPRSHFLPKLGSGQLSVASSLSSAADLLSGLSIENLDDENQVYIALEDCDAESAEDLMFLKGEEIIVLEKDSPVKWKGTCEGVTGFFNPKYVVQKERPTEEIDQKDEEFDEESACEWLIAAGFQHLVTTFKKNEPITPLQISRANLFLTPGQFTAVSKRAQFLNMLFSKKRLLAEDERDRVSISVQSWDEEQSSEPGLPISGSMSTLLGPSADLNASSENGPHIATLSKDIWHQSRGIAFVELDFALEKYRIRSKKRHLPFKKAFRALVHELKHAQSNLQKPLGSLRNATAPNPKVFGESLKDVVKLHGCDSTRTQGKIPILLDKCFEAIYADGLNTSGIFRINGSTKWVNEAREACDKDGGENPPISTGCKIFDIAALVKLFFRELSEPLFPSKLIPFYLVLPGICAEDPKSMVRCLQLLSILLPAEHRDTACAFLGLLHEISNHSEKNLMDATNLGKCLAPALFGDSCAVSAARDDYIVVAELLIKEYDKIFLMPPDIWRQIRGKMRQNERNGDRSGNNGSMDDSFGSPLGSRGMKERGLSVGAMDILTAPTTSNRGSPTGTTAALHPGGPGFRDRGQSLGNWEMLQTSLGKEAKDRDSVDNLSIKSGKSSKSSKLPNLLGSLGKKK